MLLKVKRKGQKLGVYPHKIDIELTLFDELYCVHMGNIYGNHVFHLMEATYPT